MLRRGACLATLIGMQYRGPGALVVAWPHDDRYAWRLPRCLCLASPRPHIHLLRHPPTPTTDELKLSCTACPVIDECRDYALASRESWGVWGGMTVAERRALLRRRVGL